LLHARAAGRLSRRGAPRPSIPSGRRDTNLPFPEAAKALEALLPEVPESFEVHELLGLVYSALSQDAKASPHLEKAVR